MSQPPFQPPPPPAQPPQNSYNPYSQPAPPQQAPGYAQQPPVPGQAPMYPVPGQPAYPMQPAPGFQAPPFGQQPSATGNPVGAVFLGLLASFVVSALCSGLILATYADLNYGMSLAVYFGHALLNGAVVGIVVGKVGGRSVGARIGAPVIAALGAFFGWANALPLIYIKADSLSGLTNLLQAEPFYPAKAWWIEEESGGVDWTSPIGLVLAAAVALGLAFAVGNQRRQG